MGFKDLLRQAVIDLPAEVDDLSAKILAIPGLIREQQDVVREAKKAVEDAQKDLDLAEAEIMTSVATELNGEKLRFSNKESREAEVTRRMTTDENYLVAKETLRDAEDSLHNVTMELNKLYDESKAYRHVLDAKTTLLKVLFS